MTHSKDRFHSKVRFDPNVESQRLLVGITVLFQGVMGFLQKSMDSFDRVNRHFNSVKRLFNIVNKES